MRLQFYLPLFLLFFTFSTLYAQVKVSGYYRKDGTYVKPHYRSSPDGNPYNNWSYPGNINPYTGKVATGNASTYLRNYYGNSTYSYASASDYSDKFRSAYLKVYDNYSLEQFDNYVITLTNTDYSYIKKGNSYTLTDNRKRKTGSVKYSHTAKRRNFFFLYDNDENYIGIVETKRNGKKYTVFDSQGYQVDKEDRGNGTGLLWGILLGGGIVYFLGTAYQ